MLPRTAPPIPMIDTPATAPTEAFCDVSRLRYSAAGAGERAIVLLHGWGDTKEIWRATVAALSTAPVSLRSIFRGMAARRSMVQNVCSTLLSG